MFITQLLVILSIISLLLLLINGSSQYKLKTIQLKKNNNKLLSKLLSYHSGSSGQVSHITTEDEFDQIIEQSNDKLIIIDFTATWCGPCKYIAPIYDEFANDFNEAIFLKIDVDELPSIAERYEVRAMPTFIFIKNGQVVSKFSGADGNKLRETIISYL